MGHTTVDLDTLKASLDWLKDAKATVDLALERVKTVITVVGDAPVNESDPHRGPANIPTVAPVAAGVPGSATGNGPTYFGIFENARKVAAKHAGIYNSVVAGLVAQSAALEKAIGATRYMIENYAKVEQLNSAGMKGLLANPPYQPASAEAASGSGGGF